MPNYRDRKTMSTRRRKRTLTVNGSGSTVLAQAELLR